MAYTCVLEYTAAKKTEILSIQLFEIHCVYLVFYIQKS